MSQEVPARSRRAPPRALAQTDVSRGKTRAPRRAPGRPTLAAAARLREDFIQSALSSFLVRGYAGTSIDALARESGVHKDTLYRLYGDKETIYLAAVAHGMAQLRARLAMIRVDAADPKAVLLSFISHIHEELTKPDAVAVLRLTIAEAGQFPEVAEKLFHDCGGNLKPLVDCLAALSKAGAIDVDDPVEAANQLSLYAVDGIRFLMTRPLSSRRARLAHARKVLAFLLKAWASKLP